jgi:hypothetical protein
MKQRLVAVLAATAAIAAFPALAAAHPEEAGELYIPWTEFVGQERAQELARGAAPVAQPPGAQNLELVGNSDKDGTTNSDLAFNGNLVYSGNYGGFRILDVRGDKPRVVVDHACNGPQNDVSFTKLGGKTFLFQSIDSGQDREDCSSVNAPLVNGARVGYEGVRVFDVSNPAKPRFLDMIQTACGSHTHTLIPGKSRGRGGSDKAYIYVSSYPLGSGITPPDTTNPPGGADYKACSVPHKKISIIEVSAPRGKFDYRLREQALADDTTPYRGGLGGSPFIACHDIQAFLAKDIALGSCAGESQIWNISDRWRPGIEQSRNHTHIRRPADATAREYEFMHSAFFSWDGKVVATMDETGGGVEARCFGPASTDGYYYFYNVVKPGSPEPPLRSRYIIPRPQGTEECVSHNANTVPVKGRYLASAAYYQGGVSVVDFTDVDNPREVAYADVADATGSSDEWSSFWYNGRIYSNSGLGREAPTANRGLDIWKPSGDLARKTRGAKRWAYSNPQTQEAWQAP